MCGIIAILAAKKGVHLATTDDLFEEMLIVDSVRGQDSTGVFTVDKKGAVNTYKRALNSPDFVQLREFQKEKVNLVSKKVIVGHNRKATLGSITDCMAHPFTYGDITLVHNGTLLNKRTLCPDIPQFSSDSEALCFAMNQIGAKAALEAAEGAFSVIWYNHKEQTINFCRNSERPMSFAYVNKGDYIIAASESKMLSWMISRSKFVLDKDILLPEEGYIITFKLGNCQDYTSEKITLHKPVSPAYGSGYGYGKTYPFRESSNKPEPKLFDITKISASRETKMNRILRSTSYKLYDTIIFWGDRFTVYNEKTTKGIMTGYDEYGNQDCDVVAHNINGYNILDEKGEFVSFLYEARIKAATVQADNQVIINVDELRPISFEEYYTDSRTIVYLDSKESDIKPDKVRAVCSLCGGDILDIDPGHLEVNEHITGEAGMVSCITCATIIQRQNDPDWDSLLITTVM